MFLVSRYLWILLCIPFFFDSAYAAVTIDVNNSSTGNKIIDGSQVGIHPHAFGLNFGYEITDAQRRDLLPVLKGKVKFLRWPEGNKTSYYSYDYPNYAVYKDPRRAYNVANDGLPENYTDVHEFIAFCREVGAEPMIGLPLGSGYWAKPGEWNNPESWTPNNGVGRPPIWRTFDEGGAAKEAQDLVRLLNLTFNYQIKYFYIGNEFGHDAGPFFDTFGRAMTPHERDHGYLDIYFKVKEISTNAIILNNTIQKGYRQEWWHPTYASFMQGYGWSDYYGSWDVAKTPDHYQSLFENRNFRNLNTNTSERGDTIKSDFSRASSLYRSSLNIRYEWGLARGSALNLSFLEAAIVNAWNQLEQLADGVDMTSYWPIRNSSRWLSANYIYGNDITPTGHVLHLIAENLFQTNTEQKVIHSWSTPSIYTMAVRNDRSDRLSLKVFIVNKSTTVAEDVTLRFPISITGYPRIYALQFASTTGNVKDTNLANFSVTDINVQTINSNNIKVRTPPMSVTAVILDKTIQMFPQVNPARSNQGEKEWVFVLPKEARIDSIGLRVNKKVKRDYAIYFRKNYQTGRGSLIVNRSGSIIRDVPRNRFVENTNSYGHEIRIVWKTSNAPDNLGINVYGYISRDAPVLSANARCYRESFIYSGVFYDKSCGCTETQNDLWYYLTSQNMDGLTCYDKGLSAAASTCVISRFAYDNTTIEKVCGCPALGVGFYPVQEFSNGHQCYHRRMR